MSPPPLPWPARTAPERLILLFSSLLALAGAAVLAYGFLLPGGWICAWKTCTGLPCAGCGTTRAMTSLLTGDWAAALRLNPGAVGGIVLLALLDVYALGILVLRLPPWRPRLRGWRWFLAAGLLANWIYLLSVNRPG